MRPDFSDLTIDSSVEEQVSAPENQSPWMTPEGIPVKKEFTKNDKFTKQYGDRSEQTDACNKVAENVY